MHDDPCATDILGHLIVAVLHATNIQDRDEALLVARKIRPRFPWLRRIIADGGYAGEKMRKALARMGDWVLDIVKRSDRAQGFVLLPKRWIVERTFASLGRCHRLNRDAEAALQVSWSAESGVHDLRNTSP
ncbi:transposase [Gluconobacter wancherniae]|nr:transposase [Gluconobacter wancherniae]